MGTPVFFRALKWSVAAELIPKALQPLIFVFLAHLLTPDDYGVVAAAIMVISFTQMFWEAGMAKALIQRQTQIEEAANAAFWINFAMGITFSISLFLLSDWVADLFFQDARVGDVLKVMTLQIFLGAMASVHTALLQKEMKFDRLFWVKLTTVGVPSLFSIPLAYNGYSYWALVVGTLAGQAMQVIVLWVIHKWRPRFSFDTVVAKELGRFGVWVGVTGLLAWFFIWVDSLFVGSYLGTHELGLYRTGNQFVGMVFGMIFAPLLPVLYSHFSSVQDGKERLSQMFFRVIRVITFISIPLGFLLSSLSDPVSAIVFGEKWKGIEFVLLVISILNGYSWVVSANGEVYRAIGKPSYETIVNVIMIWVYLIGYYISIQQGFEIFVWTRLGLSLLALILHIVFGWFAIQLPVPTLIKVIVLATLIGLIAPVVYMFTGHWSSHPFVQILISGSISALLMGSLIFIFERNKSVQEIINLIKRK